MDDTEPGPDGSTCPHATADGDAPPRGETPPGYPPRGDAPSGETPPGAVPPGGTPPASPPGGVPPYAGWTPPGSPWPAHRPARLRRSREDRVAVGLAGGLGRYFGVDPVLFRVVFGVLALFGGSGIVLYLLGWAAVPDEDTADAPIDRAIAWLRRRHVPISLVVGVGLVVVWLAAFSWWAPSSFIPAVVLVAVLALFLMRGGAPIRAGEPMAQPAPGSYPTSAFPAPGDGTYPTTATSTSLGPDTAWAAPLPPAGSEVRTWFHESRAQARERRRRRRPLELVAVLTIVAALAGLAVADAMHGVRLGSYFWTLGAIVLVALVIGAAARRTPWPLLPLLVPAIAGVFVFGSSPVSAHDGWGDRTWTTVASGGLSSEYRTAFGRTTLDLTGLPAPATTQSTSLLMGAGQIRVIVPSTIPAMVVADVHLGEITVDGVSNADGVNFNRTYLSPAARTNPSAPRLIIHIRMTSGQISLAFKG